jgi:enoyl-CoA hydratase/carnithine racemase
MVNIKKEFEGSVWILEIDNPPMNNLTPLVVQEISQAIKSFDQDPFGRSLVVTGGGERAFIGGVAIGEIKKIQSSPHGIQLAKMGQDLCNQIEDLEKPVIAAVNGLCIGGGTEVLLACHMRIASEKAKFGQPEIAMGFIPGFGGTQRLPRLVGTSQARRLILLGEMIDAQEAYRIGLVDIVTHKEKILASAVNLARKIAEKGGVSLRLALRAIREGADMDLREGLRLEVQLFGEVCDTQDMKEGLQAFLEHRKPVFKGR